MSRPVRDRLVLPVLLPLGILVVVAPLDWISAAVLLVTAPFIPIFMVAFPTSWMLFGASLPIELSMSC